MHAVHRWRPRAVFWKDTLGDLTIFENIIFPWLPVCKTSSGDETIELSFTSEVPLSHNDWFRGRPPCLFQRVFMTEALLSFWCASSIRAFARPRRLSYGAQDLSDDVQTRHSNCFRGSYVTSCCLSLNYICSHFVAAVRWAMFSTFHTICLSVRDQMMLLIDRLIDV